jgi:hypothetical protein
MRKLDRLTVRKLAAIAKAARKEVAARGKAKRRDHRDGGGLKCQTALGGSLNWIFEYRYGGEDRSIRLGGYPRIGLKQARVLRDEKRQLLRDGVDPRGERQRAKAERVARPTFDEAVDQYIEARAPGWTEGHREQVRATLVKYASPVIGEMRVSDVIHRMFWRSSSRSGRSGLRPRSDC